MRSTVEPFPVAGVTTITPQVAPEPTAPCWWKVATIVGLLAVLFYRVVSSLANDWWRDPNFSHGFIVPLFAGYLLWQDRRKLLAIPIRGSWVGFVIVLVGLGALVGGTLGAEVFSQRFSLLVVIAGLVVYFFGWKWMRTTLFAWAVLWLMIPIPAIIFNKITFPLQIFASQLATSILQVLNVPVLREGNVINLAIMPLEVAEACSGIRSLLSLGTLAVIYGYFLENRIWSRSFLVLASIPIAVGANALRIVVTGLFVQYGRPDLAKGFFHEFSGWLVFVFALLLLLGVHGVLRVFASRHDEVQA